MTLGSPRWLRVVFLATALVFVGVAVYVFAFRFFDWVDSDAADAAVLAAKVLHAKSPVVGDWYYANGDVWVLGPQLIAMLPVAIFGLGPASLIITMLLGFVLQLVTLVRVYLRLGGELWIALFATMTTLMAWSGAHVSYVYITLAYGFVTCLYLISFHMFATLAESASTRPWRLAAAGLLVAVISVQNPTRGLVYLLAPVLAGCLWPWRSFAVRRRLALAVAAVAGWGLAFVVYTWLLSRVVAFSVPRGHLAFVFGGATRIKMNLAMLGRGLAILCGGGDAPSVRVIPGALLVVGALVLGCREVFAARAFTALRFFGVIVLAQLGGVLVPLLIGNLLDYPLAARYLMPSLLMMLGLAVVIAVRTLGDVARVWARRLAIGWLALVPVGAFVAAPGTRPPPPERYVWPDYAGLVNLADELGRRGLTHGFSLNNVGPTLLTLLSGGATMTCSIYFRNVIMPLRWLTHTSCYTASKLPDRFYVVAYPDDGDRNAIHATLPSELERFSVGDTYEVYVYRTRNTSPAWLDLPIPDGELATFPMRLPATHLQLVRDKVAVATGELVATGEPGTVLHGPYLELPKGDYEATWIGNGLDAGGQLTFSVTANGGRKVFARGALDATQVPKARGELIRLPFTLGHAWNSIELPIESVAGARISLHELVIERKR